MVAITNDEQGIPNKKVYASIAKALKKGMFASKRIDEEVARVCTDLNLVCDEITDLNFLRFFPNLDDLRITSAKLSNIQGLRYAQNLTWLQISDHQITDLSPLAYCPKLELLGLAHRTQGSPATVHDFSVIGGLRALTILSLNRSGVRDISWITGLQKLEHVGLANTPLTNFSPLLELDSLEELDLDPSQIQYMDEDYLHLAIDTLESIVKGSFTTE